MRNAARFLDPHMCDHAGGIIGGPAEQTVLLQGFPAARYTDRTPCSGPPNALDEGAPTVLVGRLPQTRIGDRTVHKGSVLTGAPLVFVGENPPWVKVVRRGNVLLIVNENAQKIVVVGVQEIAGSGADAAYAKRAQAAINAAWSGTTTIGGKTYAVEAMVTCRVRADPDTDKSPNANHVNVKQTSDPCSVTSVEDPSNQSLYGRGPGYQHSTDSDLCMAHEFGHSMGLKDEYVEVKEPGKKRRTLPNHPGDLMGDINSGAKPSQANYNSLITGDGLA